MSSDHQMVQCSTCDIRIRKESYINHILKEHQEHFWNEIVCLFEDEHGATALRTKAHMQDAINALTLDSSYEIDDEIFADFGDKTTYKQSVSASKHILRHTAKHKQNFYEALNLTPEKLAKLFAFMIKKPVKVITDQAYCKEIIDKALKEQTDLFVKKHYELSERYSKIQQEIESDDYKDFSRLKRVNKELEDQLQQQSKTLRELSKDHEYYKALVEPDEEKNYSNLQQELTLIEQYDKFKKDLERKNKKIEEDCDKKLKKFQEDTEKKDKAFEKTIKKLKSEVQAYKHELKMSKLSSNDSGSDSD